MSVRVLKRSGLRWRIHCSTSNHVNTYFIEIVSVNWLGDEIYTEFVTRGTTQTELSVTDTISEAMKFISESAARSAAEKLVRYRLVESEDSK